jgi:thiamine kinase-like enzyme
VLILEDLDAAGFDERRNQVSHSDLRACLRWLAYFHARFMGEAPGDLWASGCYWHLETRPDELEVVAKEDPKLHALAPKIDATLKASPFQTIVHGDAKLANFCFNTNEGSVAAVDFQYVGAGCGMKDVAYLIGSCIDEAACEKIMPAVLDYYFEVLRGALATYGKSIDADALEANWRGLYPVAWADFHRFLKGWSPGHWKLNDYSERIVQQVIADLC